MIGYRLLPEHVAQLSSANAAELVKWLRRVCGLNAKNVLALDFMYVEHGNITMEAHVRNVTDSHILNANVVDVRTYYLKPSNNVPEFLVKQFEKAVPVPEGGFGNVSVEPLGLIGRLVTP